MKRLIDVLATTVTDSSGNSLAGASVYTYLAGTTTLHTVYEDWDLEDPHPNPLTLNSGGWIQAYSDRRLKLVIVNSAGSTVRTIDYVGTDDEDLTEASINVIAGPGLTDYGDDGLQTEVDGSTITVGADGLEVVDGGITQDKRVALGQQLSSACASFTRTGTAYGDITNLSVSITTTGRPVFVGLVGEGTDFSYVDVDKTSVSAAVNVTVMIKFLRDSTTLSSQKAVFGGTASNDLSGSIPVSSFWHIDTPSAGTYTYKVQMRTGDATDTTGSIVNAKLIAYEL